MVQACAVILAGLAIGLCVMFLVPGLGRAAVKREIGELVMNQPCLQAWKDPREDLIWRLA